MSDLEFFAFTPGLLQEKEPLCHDKAAFSAVEAFHRSLPGYEPTPLLSLPALAARLGLGGIWLKDESCRFGMNAFKSLGASYALHRVLAEQPDITAVVSATDGNHGRAVVWAAWQQGLPAYIFMPCGSDPRRVQAIADFPNAHVTVTEVNYADSVRLAAAFAREHHACLLQDTSLPGYTCIPELITLAYSTMAREAVDQLNAAGIAAPTHAFLQAGVGSMAGGVAAYLRCRCGEQLPCITVTEAWDSACVCASLQAGRSVDIPGNSDTVMAGLNCGEINTVAFPALQHTAKFGVRCRDRVSLLGMDYLAHPAPGDPEVNSGSCGAVGVGVLLELLEQGSYPGWKQRMGLDESSVILLFNTEGTLEALSCKPGFLR